MELYDKKFWLPGLGERSSFVIIDLLKGAKSFCTLNGVWGMIFTKNLNFK